MDKSRSAIFLLELAGLGASFFLAEVKNIPDNYREFLSKLIYAKDVEEDEEFVASSNEKSVEMLLRIINVLGMDKEELQKYMEKNGDDLSSGAWNEGERLAAINEAALFFDRKELIYGIIERLEDEGNKVSKLKKVEENESYLQKIRFCSEDLDHVDAELKLDEELEGDDV